jgi:hypothetical protein
MGRVFKKNEPLEKGVLYDVTEGSIIRELSFIGKLYPIRVDVFSVKKQKQQINLEFEEPYPIYVFYSKEHGFKVFYSRRKFSANKIGEGKKMKVSKLNEMILDIVEKNEDHKIFNCKIWKSIIYFTEDKPLSFPKELLSELVNRKISTT